MDGAKTISSKNSLGMEISILPFTGYANEHHDWPVQELTPKPLSQEQLMSANVSPWAMGS